MAHKKGVLDFVPQITHVMADGTVRDSIEGYPVPYNSTTANSYHILANSIRKLQQQADNKEEEVLKKN